MDFDVVGFDVRRFVGALAIHLLFKFIFDDHKVTAMKFDLAFIYSKMLVLSPSCLSSRSNSSFALKPNRGFLNE